MKLFYDPSLNTLYIALRDKAAPVKTVRLGEDAVLDIDANGVLCGIEFQHADRLVRRGGKFSFPLVNDITGEVHEFALDW